VHSEVPLKVKFILKVVGGTVLVLVTLIVVVGVLIGAGSSSTTSGSDNSGADTEAAVENTASKSSASKGTKSHVIDRQRSSGDYAIAQASGSVDKPGTIRLRVSASPSQLVDATWMVVCSKGLGSSGSKDGQFKGTAPLSKTLKLPMSNPDDCTVSANAQLSRGGKVAVTLVG
jgi:hypothetical protein